MSTAEGKPIVDYIFPTAVYCIDHNILSKKVEKQLLKECKENYTSNFSGNTTSKDRYILDQSYMADAKQYFEKHITEYAQKVLEIESSLRFTITQSWVNMNKKDSAHHLHYHRNSFISGVYYLTDGPPISFFKRNDTLQNFDFDFNRDNIANTQQADFGIKKGRLVLFPSTLSHEVGVNVSKKERISLSFNSFFKGAMKTKEDRLSDLTIL